MVATQQLQAGSTTTSKTNGTSKPPSCRTSQPPACDFYNYYDDGVRNTVGYLECLRHVVLADPHTGQGLAFVDEHWSYAIRSAAAAVLACKWLGPTNAAHPRPRRRRHHGHQRTPLPADHCTSSTKSAAPRAAPKPANAFAQKWSQTTRHSRQTLRHHRKSRHRDADIIVGGTTSSDTLARAEWLKPGCTFISLARRELDPAGMGQHG